MRRIRKRRTRNAVIPRICVTDANRARACAVPWSRPRDRRPRRVVFGRRCHCVSANLPLLLNRERDLLASNVLAVVELERGGPFTDRYRPREFLGLRVEVPAVNIAAATHNLAFVK